MVRISTHTHTNTVIRVSAWGSVIGLATAVQLLSNSVVDPGCVFVLVGRGGGSIVFTVSVLSCQLPLICASALCNGTFLLNHTDMMESSGE